jgi:D-3-phosphoglycerate dehydrogenase
VENVVEIAGVGSIKPHHSVVSSGLHHDGARTALQKRNIILTAMHIVIADQLPASAIEILRTVPAWTVDARTQRPAAELARDLANADALIVRSATTVDASVIADAPKLRVIARAGTGVDNVDVAAATARGIVVMNSPGANSVSVAEHALALMLSLARAVPAADAAMKRGVWDKKRLTGAELRGKTLGVIGLGRIGQEVAARARAFGMDVMAHDPFISEQIAQTLGIDLLSVDELCARADYLTLHVPATAETRHLIDARRLALCKPGVRVINTARGELIDEAALADAIEKGHVGGAGLDVFEQEPPPDGRLTKLPQVVATPHIAASTVEAQEMVGTETAMNVRDFLRDGVIRNAVNFPALPAEEYALARPWMQLAGRLGSLVAQLATGRTHAVGIRYYGPLVSARSEMLASAVVAGVLQPLLSSAVTIVNARAVAVQRGIEIIETRSSRPRDFTNLLSVKLHTSEGERWVEGTVFEPGMPRLAAVDGVEIEAPLEGTLIVITNNDQPGVIGEVGTILGRHGLNIANFALGRATSGAVGLVKIDEPPAGDSSIRQALDEIRASKAIRTAALVRV